MGFLYLITVAAIDGDVSIRSFDQTFTFMLVLRSLKCSSWRKIPLFVLPEHFPTHTNGLVGFFNVLAPAHTALDLRPWTMPAS